MKVNDEMRGYVARGVCERFKSIKFELELIERVLRQAGLTQKPSIKRKTAIKDATPTKRRQTHMSAAARKAVSIRMKKYWAARRKAKESTR